VSTGGSKGCRTKMSDEDVDKLQFVAHSSSLYRRYKVTFSADHRL
jgi:hypothetical protein